MTEFTRRPLQLLDRVYRFVGGTKGVNRLGLNRDITLVHDVSREAERSGIPPWFGYLEWKDSCSTAATLEKNITRDADILPLLHGVDSELDYELYILRVCSHVVAADIGDVDFHSFSWHTLTTDPDFVIEVPGSTVNRMDLIYSCAGSDFGMFANSAGADYYGCSYMPVRPIRTMPEAMLQFQADHNASANAWFAFDLWAGPLGSTPPGLP